MQPHLRKVGRGIVAVPQYRLPTHPARHPSGYSSRPDDLQLLADATKRPSLQHVSACAGEGVGISFEPSARQGWRLHGEGYDGGGGTAEDSAERTPATLPYPHGGGCDMASYRHPASMGCRAEGLRI